MFYDNISLTNKEKLLKSIPKFEEERIFYFRHEKGNKKSFAIVNGKTQEMVMNGEAWEILKLCNGERIVEQIKEDFATRYSYMNPTADFLKDVVVTLFAFDKLWALSWGKGGSPFMVNGTIKLNEKYDLICIFCIICIHFICSKYFPNVIFSCPNQIIFFI